jgi:DNA-binding winged helix-turn-helix (wHTH) protein
MRLGASEFDAATGEVRRGDVVLRLEPQPAALLQLLLSRPAELITHDEIRRAIWGETTHVNFQQGLHYCVRQIRKALDDSARDPKFIHTIPRRGYRLTIPVEAPPARQSGIGRRLVWAGVAAALVVTTYIVEQRPNRHHEMVVAVLGAAHDLVY